MVDSVCERALLPLCEYPSNITRDHLTVLCWTHHFFGEDYVKPFTVSLPTGQCIDVDFTTNRDVIEQCDAIWFHAPSIRDMPPRRPGLKRILMCMESDKRFPVISFAGVYDHFDLLMTYRLDSDIPCPYPSYREYGDFRRRRHATHQSTSSVAYIASNPMPYRDNYVAQLMQYTPVDCLGECLNNRRPQNFVFGRHSWARGGWDSLVSVLNNYRFYLALENSRSLDYVTERLFHALSIGSVPVYMGAGNVEDFLPAENCIINVDDFDGPGHLAEYLQYLEQDDSSYAQYLAWKDKPFANCFEYLLRVTELTPLERMAIKLAHGCDRDCRCGGRLRLQQYHIKPGD